MTEKAMNDQVLESGREVVPGPVPDGFVYLPTGFADDLLLGPISTDTFKAIMSALWRISNLNLEILRAAVTAERTTPGAYTTVWKIQDSDR